MPERTLRQLSSEVSDRIHTIIQDKAVLVGGQSLAFWVARYDIPIYERMGAISMDADYLGDKSIVETIARGFPHSSIVFPPSTAMTALVGSVHIIPDDYSYMNVDVILKVVGIPAEHVRLCAVPVQLQLVVHGHHKIGDRFTLAWTALEAR